MKDYRLSKYLVVTFLITWICWISLSVLIKLGIINFYHPLAIILHLIGGFGPTIASILVFNGKVTIKSIFKWVFKYNKRTIRYLLLFCFAETLVIGSSSLEINTSFPLYIAPLVFVQAVLIYGGNEELGWRGTMQPIMESKMPFPFATLITGIIWSIWHSPLWFVNGASQQNIPFILFTLLGIFLSFWLAAIYKRTQSVFFCSLLHGLNNTLLSLFVIKVNFILIIGFIVMLFISLYIWYLSEKVYYF